MHNNPGLQGLHHCQLGFRLRHGWFKSYLPRRSDHKKSSGVYEAQNAQNQCTHTHVVSSEVPWVHTCTCHVHIHAGQRVGTSKFLDSTSLVGRDNAHDGWYVMWLGSVRFRKARSIMARSRLGNLHGQATIHGLWLYAHKKSKIKMVVSSKPHRRTWSSMTQPKPLWANKNPTGPCNFPSNEF